MSWLVMISVIICVGINVINIYNNNELMISLIILRGLMICSDTFNRNINYDDNS